MGQEHDDYADPPTPKRQRRLFWAVVLLVAVVGYYVANRVIDHLNLFPPP